MKKTKPGKNQIWINFQWIFLGFFGGVMACENHPIKQNRGVLLPKTLPDVYINLNNKEFRFHQDTLFYKNQLFTGYIFGLYPHGDTSLKNGYFNGLKEGVQKLWYSNGHPSETRNYINGIKEGEQKGWWPNGQLKFLFYTENDAYSGEFKEWDPKGFLYKDFHYIQGQEEGRQKLWWGNHTLRSNYQIMDGKRYGLLGNKICKNPYDSINKN